MSSIAELLPRATHRRHSEGNSDNQRQWNRRREREREREREKHSNR
jgi:hypothetical protein